ncbi:MAG: cyclase family protein, partial [Methanomicrobiales archaeon]|nr:cyclase family protein [Methanomicrobiales archaeon]
LIGPCLVLDMRGSPMRIEPHHVIPRMKKHTRILLHTTASEKGNFGEEFSHLSLQTAQALTDRGIVCVGIDSPSIEEYPGDGSVHRALLSRNTVIIELLDLSDVDEGSYWLVALPLRLQGREGAPARVILCRSAGT